MKVILLMFFPSILLGQNIDEALNLEGNNLDSLYVLELKKKHKVDSFLSIEDDHNIYFLWKKNRKIFYTTSDKGSKKKLRNKRLNRDFYEAINFLASNAQIDNFQCPSHIRVCRFLDVVYYNRNGEVSNLSFFIPHNWMELESIRGIIFLYNNIKK